MFNQIPYGILQQKLPPSFGSLDGTPIYICANLLDTRYIGIGATREESMERMREQTLKDPKLVEKVCDKLSEFLENHVDVNADNQEDLNSLLEMLKIYKESNQ